MKKKHIVRLSYDGTEVEYRTLKGATKSIQGAWSSPIKRACQGKQPTAFGYRWRYVTPDVCIHCGSTDGTLVSSGVDSEGEWMNCECNACGWLWQERG